MWAAHSVPTHELQLEIVFAGVAVFFPTFQCTYFYEAEMVRIVGVEREFCGGSDTLRDMHCKNLIMEHASAGPVVPSEKCIILPAVKVRSTDETLHLVDTDLLSNITFSFFLSFFASPYLADGLCLFLI